MINYDDFAKIELKVARIMEAEAVPNSDKLIRLIVSTGATPEDEKEEEDSSGESDESSEGEQELDSGTRQIVAGIGKAYAPEDLIGKEIVIVANLEPRKLMGVESQGMLLAASDEDGPVLLIPELDVAPGSRVK